MKKLLFLTLGLTAFTTHAQEVVDIPDTNFKKALLYHDPVIDTNNDGEIQLTEAQAAKKVVVYNQNIKNLKGIEAFSNISFLDCHGNNLMHLNLENNKLLERVDCYDNKLTFLKVPDTKSLQYLYCKNNDLGDLDVKANTNLITLSCSNNKIKELDLSQNKAIESLDITGNLISSTFDD
ncbi:leucine-rich repeat domain-containing protein [Aquimarina rhabdastrellae]